MTESLAGRVALVTGASSGIGEGAALGLARAGVRVAVSARRADRLEALVARIRDEGGDALALPGDVSDEAHARDAVARTVDHFGKIDILINSAGAMQPGGVVDANIAHYRELMEINFFATLYTCTEALKHMKAKGRGDIVNISSTAGRRASGNLNPYASSKFALTALTEGMRQEVGGRGIRVCIIEPGATTTEISDNVADPTLRQTLQEHVAADGVMKVEDITETVLYVLGLPARANVSQILIRPTIDAKPI